ncbi:MAG: M23 family metallopeptidase [Clostridia bacterium]|nr:M23 family metallopeptidase [Clostridia bacterium]
MGGGRVHRGIDIVGAGIYGAPIVAAQSGTVITAYTSDTWGYGWGYHVMIGHSDGYATQYAHMSRVVVKKGQYVQKGQVIGYVGNTGDSYGAHLHFELWSNGTRINPSAVLDYTPSY